MLEFISGNLVTSIWNGLEDTSRQKRKLEKEERPEGQIYSMDRSQLLKTEKVTWLSGCAKKTQVPGDSWAIQNQIWKRRLSSRSLLEVWGSYKGTTHSKWPLSTSLSPSVWAPSVLDKFLCLSHWCPSSWVNEPEN